MRASLVRIALAVALCLGVAGCGNDAPVPKPYTGPSKSATRAAAPLPSPQATLRSGDGAIAFVNYYFQVFGFASNTGNVDLLQTLSEPQCDSCNRVLKAIGRTYQAGGSSSGSTYKTTEASSQAEPDVRLVMATVSSTSQVITHSAKSKPEKIPSFREKVQFQLVWADHSWKIRQWTRL